MTDFTTWWPLTGFLTLCAVAVICAYLTGD
jgi:hypothetical protein